jgi:hypothetical protein
MADWRTDTLDILPGGSTPTPDLLEPSQSLQERREAPDWRTDSLDLDRSPTRPQESPRAIPEPPPPANPSGSLQAAESTGTWA